MSTSAEHLDGDGLQEAGRLLGELAEKHAELVALCREHQATIAALLARPTEPALLERLRDMPGARYHEAQAFARIRAFELQAAAQAAVGEHVTAHLTEEAIMDALWAAGEPVREAVLFERAHARGADVSAEVFQACLTALETEGYIRMRAEPPDLAARDPEPFQPRYYWPVK